jgi:organic hydroperoxide reductase OsmC/OhrA
MSEHKARVYWNRGQDNFLDNKYSRAHKWQLDGGLEIDASSSPSVVPLPMSKADAIDPEEAFVASLSSCHMLWFLSIAAKRKYGVDSYIDNAVGILGKDPKGNFYISKVTLTPEVQFFGENQPNKDELLAMHEEAHQRCFIANSVKSEVICNPIFGTVEKRSQSF